MRVSGHNSDYYNPAVIGHLQKKDQRCLMGKSRICGFLNIICSKRGTLEAGGVSKIRKGFRKINVTIIYIYNDILNIVS